MPRNRHLFVFAVLALSLFACLVTALLWRADEAPMAKSSQSDASSPDASKPTDQAGNTDANGVAIKRHAVHPKQESVWIERMHKALTIPFHGPLEAGMKQSITAALSRAAEHASNAASATGGAQPEFASLTDKKRYYENAHGVALLFGELEAIEKDRYLRYGGRDLRAFYQKCMNRYPDAYFACVGADEAGRQIILVVPAPSGSQLATLADVTVELAQQGY